MANPNPPTKQLKGHDFKSKPQNINRKGRPKLLLRTVNEQLTAQGFTRVSANQLLEADELILNCTEQKIRDIATDKDMPMVLRIVAKEMLSKEGYAAVQSMRDRAYGKAAQEIKSTGNGPTTVVNIGYVKPS